MHENGTHKCEERIVSLQQPHVRPINRGKRPNPTEFGQKLHLSVVDGFTYLEKTSWNSFNEGKELIDAAEDYRRKFGCYPEAILADRIYQTRENRAFCKAHDIRLSGPPLGSSTVMPVSAMPSKAETETPSVAGVWISSCPNWNKLRKPRLLSAS